jgi:hypothetical protein
MIMEFLTRSRWFAAIDTEEGPQWVLPTRVAVLRAGASGQLAQS